MRFSAAILAIAAGLAAVKAQDTPVGTFVSSNIRTYTSSKCSTASGTVSVAPVPTSTTSTARMPNVAISSTNTNTPLAIFTQTVTSMSTVTSYVLASTPPAPAARRDSLPTAEPARRQQDGTSDDVMAQKVHELNGATPPSKRENSTPGRVVRRAMYPTQVNCAVTTMVMTTSMFIATAAPRYTASATVTTTAATATTATVTAAFNLKLGARRGGSGSGLNSYFALDSNKRPTEVTNKNAAVVLYYQPASKSIVTADGLILGIEPSGATDPLIRFYTADQMTSQKIAAVQVNPTQVSNNPGFDLALLGTYTWWWFCSGYFLAIETQQYGCPTWYVYADPIPQK